MARTQATQQAQVASKRSQEQCSAAVGFMSRLSHRALRLGWPLRTVGEDQDRMAVRGQCRLHGYVA